MNRPMHGRLRRALRRFTLGSGPLKRPSDRIEVLGRVLVALSVLAAVPLAFLASAITRGSMASTAAVQAADRHAARAVVLTDTRAPDPTASAALEVVRTEVRWPGARGVVRRGQLLLPAGTRAGTAIPVWVDRGGNLTTAPLDEQSIGGTSFAAGVAVVLVVPLVAWGLHVLLCAVLDARRRRQWAQGWARVEREWSSTLH
jgi:hypothetical protein